ncbi:MAG: hypothetical protein LH491_09010, partial [Pseudoxanthomonas sp.]|nr:hypothetical protein [Pseudoxanthomonas sp.]
VAKFPAEDPRRQIQVNFDQRTQARLRLIEGQPQAALSIARAELDRLGKLTLPTDNAGAQRMMRNVLRFNLSIGATAALQLDRAVEAEAMIRQWQAIPADDRSTNFDPRDLEARSSTLLAHAIALQGRGEEARTALAPALAYYRQQQEDGAKGTSFRGDLAYALYVSALTRAPGEKERMQQLAEAKRVLDGASAEARQLSDFRDLYGWIAAARSGGKA